MLLTVIVFTIHLATDRRTRYTHKSAKKELYNNGFYAINALSAIAYNESHVCDVALSPTRAKGHVAERRAAAPRSPRHPEGVPMHIRAVMRSCAYLLSVKTFRIESVFTIMTSSQSN